jgi:SAM-dependent methyltransferase
MQALAHDTSPRTAHSGGHASPADRKLNCCVCGQHVEAWLPHPHRQQRSEFMKLMEAVGSDLAVYQCPACLCTDRDRHLWLYMNAVGLPSRLAGAVVLHLAPERHLEALLMQLDIGAYVRGDLHPTRPDHLKLDAQALPFEDGSVDVIICNHVLEHVQDPQRALSEMYRCLENGGLLIAQTPYSPRLKRTLELNDAPSPEFARLFFGQNDHVRLFGTDLFQMVTAAGFKGDPAAHESLLPDIDPQTFGCNAREPFFAFWK